MTSVTPRFSRQELLSSRFAAGAIVVLSLTLAGAANAQRTAVLTPVAAPSSASQPRSATNLPPAAAPDTQFPAASAQASGQPPGMVLDQIGLGDMVRVIVFRNPELTTEAKISERGTILFPMIGEVPVAGLTPYQAGQRIADKLKQGRFVVNPEVTVSLAQVNSRQVSVLGNVNKPGRYPLDAMSTRLTDFLAVAGGVATPGSDLVTIVSMHDGKTTKKDVDLAAMFRNGDLSANLDLQPGDTVYVHKAPMVYVYGEVQRGGAYRVEPHMTVMQALALGGGVTARGTQRGIKITRRNGERVSQIDARLTDPVQPDDVIFVRESLF
jgi:polysaccharide export outer membrane protein